MSGSSTFFTLYGEMPAVYQAGWDLLLLSHSLTLEDIAFLWLMSQLISLYFCSLNAGLNPGTAGRGSAPPENQWRANVHCCVAEFVPRLGWRNWGACKWKCLSVLSHGKFLLAGSSASGECKRKEDWGERKEKLANRACMVFKEANLSAL